MSSDKKFLSTAEAAHYVDCSCSSLEHWRMAKKGPPFVQIGPRKIRYRTADLEEWIESRVITN